MNIKKGFCRIVLKSGMVILGEVQEIEEKQITFNSFTQSMAKERIEIENIAFFEEYAEEDIPAYE